MSPVPVPGGVFFGPPFPPTPPSAQGFGFPLGVHTSPRGRGPHGSELPALLLDFFLASIPASRGPGARGPSFLLYFHTFRRPGFQAPSVRDSRNASPCFQGPGLPLCFHAFRRPGFLYTFRGPDFQLSGDHAARLSGGFQGLSGGPASRWPDSALLPGVRAFLNFFSSQHLRLFVFASQPPGFQGTGGQGLGPEDRGPGDQFFEIPILYKYTHFQDITPRFFSFFRISIHFDT